jgi:hypothetical protein
LGKKGMKGAGIGGGILGIIFVMFSLLHGPFQFIHFAQTEQKHFAANQDASDDRFGKLARLIRSRDIKQTRMGWLGSKYASNIETKMNANGIESSYTDVLQYYDGYTVDPEKGKFQGMSNDEIKQYFKDNYGIELKTAGELTDATAAQKAALGNKLSVSAKGMGYFEKRGLIKSQLTETGYAKVTSAILARVMGRWGGVTWHPMTLADQKLNQTLVDFFKKMRGKQAEYTKNGGGPLAFDVNEDPLAEGNNDSPAVKQGNNTKRQNASQTHGTITATEAEATAAAADIKTGDTAKFSAFKQGINSKLSLAAGPAAALGVLCMVKGINDNAGQIKYAQVILPLIRQGVELVAIGNQIMTGQGVDPDQMRFFNDELSGKDSSGKTSSWVEARSVQALMGQPQTGPLPSKTLTTIGKGEPFDWLSKIPAVGFLCNSITQGVIGGISLVTSLFTGEALGAITGAVIQTAGGALAGDEISHWLAGEAVDTFPVGVDDGYAVDYGTTLAAGLQGATAGGRELTPDENNKLAEAEFNESQTEFNSHSLTYKLFDPYDSRTAISKFIDTQSPNISQDISNMATGFLNFGRVFSSLSRVFTPRAHAVSTYDYGFPNYGFSIDELNNPAMADPYKNAENAATILSGDKGKDYQDKAKKCFGVDVVSKLYDDGTKKWEVDPLASVGNPKGLNPYDPKYKNNNCGDSSDPNWLVMRFFIFDSETMDAAACYEGEAQSCSNLGFGGSDSASTSTDSSSSTDTTTPAASSNGYTTPFHSMDGVVLSRIDEGVDYAAASGKTVPVYPIGNATIVLATDHSSFFTTSDGHSDWITYQLSDPPAKGKYVYVSEACTINPDILSGRLKQVTPQTKLCDMLPSSIEMGWALDSSSQAAAAYYVYSESHATAYGVNFDQLMQKLGVPGGHYDHPGETPEGTLPADWPRW